MNLYIIYYRRELGHPGFTVPTEVSGKDYTCVTSLMSQSLEHVFREMNVVDGTELPVRLGVRSLSVGDVVQEKDGRSWYCASFGWEEVAWLP